MTYRGRFVELWATGALRGTGDRIYAGEAGMTEHNVRDDVQRGSTRRQALRRFWLTGVLATASTGLSELLMVPSASAATVEGVQLPVSIVLDALPPDAPVGLREAVASGCCLKYTRTEGECSPACGTGHCCYTISGCYDAGPLCISVPCSRGDFTSGC